MLGANKGRHMPMDRGGGARHSPREFPGARGAPQTYGRIAPMKWLLQILTWWNGQTLNTRFHTWRHGEFVGKDEFGNLYYRTKGGRIDPALGFERRWVIFSGISEASITPPGWFGWLNHSTDIPPTEETYVPREWEKAHLPNLTGTPLAYRPAGSIAKGGVRPPATGDYKAWTPGA